ncbi:unnamed protein product [Rotaria sp. Silwood1]|nr:unnamed protein product [Rotaria sp. Silwood1]
MQSFGTDDIWGINTPHVTTTNKPSELTTNKPNETISNIAINATPMTDEEGNCGWNLAITYILSPTFEPDRSCLNKISQIDFSGATTRSK